MQCSWLLDTGQLCATSTSRLSIVMMVMILSSNTKLPFINITTSDVEVPPRAPTILASHGRAGICFRNRFREEAKSRPKTFQVLEDSC
jgi:hypothetical protein